MHYIVRMSSKNVHDSGSRGSQDLQSNAGWSTKLEVDKQARFQKQVSWGNRLVEGVQLVQLLFLGKPAPSAKVTRRQKRAAKALESVLAEGDYNYRGLLIIM